MSYSLIVDLAFLAVIIFSIFLCAKRGLFKSISGIAGTVIGFIGARMLGGKVAAVIESIIRPVFKKIFNAENVQHALTELASKATDGIDSIKGALVESGLSEQTAALVNGALEKMDGSITDMLAEQDVATLSVTLADSASKAVAPVIAFIILFIVIKLLVSLVCNLLSVNIPVLRELNTLGGIVFGLASGLLIVILICWGVVIFAPDMEMGFFSVHTLESSSIGGFITDIFW